jgi:hypothetical protein
LPALQVKFLVYRIMHTRASWFIEWMERTMQQKKKKQEKQNARDDSYTSLRDSIDVTTLKELVELVRRNVHCSDTKLRRVFHPRNTPSFT